MTTLIIDPFSNRVFTDRQGTISANYETFLGKQIYTPTNYIKADKMAVVNSCVVVGCGAKSLVDSFRNSFAKQAEFPKILPHQVNTTVYVVRAKNKGVQADKYYPVQCGIFKRLEWEKVSKVINGYVADGSGAEYALGALKAGVSPEEAIKIASDLDVFTDSEVAIMELPTQEGEQK